jgi:hypothetical protein
VSPLDERVHTSFREFPDLRDSWRSGYAVAASTPFDSEMRAAVGFQTKSRGFGPDSIPSFDGVMRDDLNS